MINRGIRLKDAPGYLGIDTREFNKNYRHLLTECRIGRKVIFDRVELDELFDHTIKCGRQAPKHSIGGATCQRKSTDYINAKTQGIIKPITPFREQRSDYDAVRAKLLSKTR